MLPLVPPCDLDITRRQQVSADSGNWRHCLPSAFAKLSIKLHGLAEPKQRTRLDDGRAAERGCEQLQLHGVLLSGG
jgi:hypothetical protein